ncbi:VP22-1 [Symbiodinium sp. CCMP2592]|nr:VP22-1 [Symbiodinium sp. CCMP2592]
MVPLVSLDSSSPFHGCASSMLQTAVDSCGKVDGLYEHCFDERIQRDLERKLNLRLSDYMLAQVKSHPDVRGVGLTKRRQPGLAGLMRGQAQQSALSAVGERMEADKGQQAQALLQNLQKSLGEFASRHRDRINSDPQFRKSFCEMCIAAGVDPLASSKGLWDELLGVGQFYNDLAVQVLTLCLTSRDENGGLLDLKQCLTTLRRSRARGDLGLEDIERAVDCLAQLGPGVSIRICGKHRLICSIPEELSDDPAQALDLAARRGGKICAEDLIKTGWGSERAESALRHCIREGLCWVDTQDDQVPTWCWFPSIALAEMDKSGLGLTGTVKTKKLWSAMSEFDPEVAKKFDELLTACWEAPQTKETDNSWWNSGSGGWGGGKNDDDDWGTWKDRSRSTRGDRTARKENGASYGWAQPTQGKQKAKEEPPPKKAKLAQKLSQVKGDKDNKINSFREAFIDNPGPPRQMPYANQHDDRADSFVGGEGFDTRSEGGKSTASGEPIRGRNTDPERSFMRFCGQPKPEDVRPLHVLREALLLAKEKWRSQRDWSHVGEMLRSISQDLRVQHLHNGFAVEAHEYWAEVALESGDFRAFNTAAQELEAYYEDPELEQGAAKVKEILAWYILYLAIEGEGVATSRFLQKHSKRLGVGQETTTPVVQFALSLRRNLAQQRFLQVVKTLGSQPADNKKDVAETLIPNSLRLEMLRKAKLEALISLCKAFDKMRDLRRSRLESLDLLSEVDGGSELPIIYQEPDADLVDTHATHEEAKKLLGQHDKRQVLPTGGVRIVRRLGRPSNDHLTNFVRQNSGANAATKPQRKQPKVTNPRE